tara:strand:- start:193 stop:339 length:147 start_codon:yes stop_codon:yes gene_type:complete
MTTFLQCIAFKKENIIQVDSPTEDEKLWNDAVNLGVKIMLNADTSQQN